MRAAAIHSDPTFSLQEARNVAGSVAPSSVEDTIFSTSDPYPSDVRSTNHPLPDDDNQETQGDSKSFSNAAHNRYAY